MTTTSTITMPTTLMMSTMSRLQCKISLISMPSVFYFGLFFFWLRRRNNVILWVLKYARWKAEQADVRFKSSISMFEFQISPGWSADESENISRKCDWKDLGLRLKGWRGQCLLQRLVARVSSTTWQLWATTNLLTGNIPHCHEKKFTLNYNSK